MRGNSILVVGGGIGGLSAAIALSDAGFAVRVVEIQNDLHSSVFGVGIIQPVNALRALGAIGCLDPCLEAGYASSGWSRLYDEAGNVVDEVRGATIPGSSLPPMNGIGRPQLHQILTERALASGARIDYGVTVSTFTERADSVDVQFTDGRQASFNLVVGADGVRSNLRTYVAAREIQPTYNGQSAFRLTIPRDPDVDRIVSQRGRNGNFGIVPIGAETAYLYMNIVWDRARRVRDEELPAMLIESLAPFGGPAGHAREHHVHADSQIVFRPGEWLIVEPPWHRGHVVLIGDAVHAVTPHLGQGAAQAIEDGIVLADCLRRESRTEAALTAYTERRFERCRLIVESSVRIGARDQGRTEDFDLPALVQGMIEAMVAPI